MTRGVKKVAVSRAERIQPVLSTGVGKIKLNLAWVKCFFSSFFLGDKQLIT